METYQKQQQRIHLNLEGIELLQPKVVGHMKVVYQNETHKLEIYDQQDPNLRLHQLIIRARMGITLNKKEKQFLVDKGVLQQ